LKLRLLAQIPEKIQGKLVTKRELDKYFGTKSIYQLIEVLQYGKELGYFSVELLIEDLNRSKSDGYTKLIRNVYPVYESSYVGASPNQEYTLPASIKAGVVLNKKEIGVIITRLSEHSLETHLRFKLSAINYDELRKIIKPKKTRKNKDDGYRRAEWDGFVVDGSEASYLGEKILLGFQQRQILRILIKYKGKLVAPDIFTNNRDIFTKNQYKSDINHLLAQHISATHKKVKAVVHKDCIMNEPNEGWKLEIQDS